ncbi:MAG: PQQ-dependent sugar dehydrogenase, partial [Proteobacteria bacterium]|nr:PQQ-dependent sugar dehydrogenase [Pseudomonadota bacterium]
MRAVLLAASLALAPTLACSADGLPLDELHLPPGFRITEYARVPNARAMALGTNGTLFVGSMSAGKVYAITPSRDATRADRIRTIANDLRMPVGVAFKDGALYVSAVDRILRFDAIEARLDNPPPARVVTDHLPSDAAHGWRFIAFGPEGKLYVPIGAPCNVCDKPGYAKLTRRNVDGSGAEDVALGIRNTVGFDWQPATKTLWFTDNGRDWLGDDAPSDELNRVERLREHFGFPYCHQGDLPDPEFGKGHPCSEFTPPVLKLGAHVAALGMRFYTGTQFPPQYRNSIFIAEHGSWNRSAKVGYRVVNVRVDGARVL